MSATSAQSEETSTEKRSTNLLSVKRKRNARAAIDKLSYLPLKLLRTAAVRDRTGLSRSTIWRLEQQGAFPKRIRVSANIVAWTEDDVAEWIRRRTERVPAETT
jgi:prophage regulatory protein